MAKAYLGIQINQEYCKSSNPDVCRALNGIPKEDDIHDESIPCDSSSCFKEFMSAPAMIFFDDPPSQKKPNSNLNCQCY